jgi:hypothetical protein
MFDGRLWRSSGRNQKITFYPLCVMSILALLSAANCARAASNLPAGSTKGSLTYDGAIADLTFATAFVDQKDERKSIVLVISDQKLPVEKWESECQMRRSRMEP